jgi:putative addiction module antidote
MISPQSTIILLGDYNSDRIYFRKHMEVKLRKVGNSIGTSFPKEVLDRLGLVEGDIMNLVVTDDGIKLVIHDPNFDKVMETYKLGASQYRNAMRELAERK